MNDNNSDQLNILRKLVKNPSTTQRKLAKELGFSLGKLNYCMKSLRNKGLIKISNFKKSKNKIKYIYILTPSGIAKKNKTDSKFHEKKNERI